jgi:hypothetical protein
MGRPFLLELLFRGLATCADARKVDDDAFNGLPAGTESFQPFIRDPCGGEAGEVPAYSAVKVRVQRIVAARHLVKPFSVIRGDFADDACGLERIQDAVDRDFVDPAIRADLFEDVFYAKRQVRVYESRKHGHTL